MFAHNCVDASSRLIGTLNYSQITVSNDRYLVQLELPGFSPEDFALKSKGDAIILEAKHQGKAGDDEVTSR